MQPEVHTYFLITLNNRHGIIPTDPYTGAYHEDMQIKNMATIVAACQSSNVPTKPQEEPAFP